VIGLGAIAWLLAARSSTTPRSAAWVGSAGGPAGGGGGANVADGLADHRAHRGPIEGLEAAVGERGESAGISSATTSVRAETAIRARWDRP
jgi:hypothetical protein